MNTTLYNTLFSRMDELGAIRKDLSFGCIFTRYETECVVIYNDGDKIKYISGHEINETSAWHWDGTHGFNSTKDAVEYTGSILGHPPILSDCLQAVCTLVRKNKYLSYAQGGIDFVHSYDLSQPLLKDQTDDLGSKLLELLS